jgi:hypothetical protein
VRVPEGVDETIEFRPPSPTVQIPTVDPAGLRRSHVALLFVAAAAAAFLVGIAVASTTRTPPRGILLVTETVGPSGATLRFEGGEIRIPAGALTAPAPITVRRSLLRERVQVRLPGHPASTFGPNQLEAYAFEPAGVSFRKEVEIVFRLSGQTGNGAVFARVGSRTVLLGGDVDSDRGTVTIQVRDFAFRSNPS